MSKKETDLLICSFRYALGRRSVIVPVIAEYLKEDWHKLNEWQQQQIKDDIRHAIEYGCAGDDCDVDIWKCVLGY